jgi:hypothetical protein
VSITNCRHLAGKRLLRLIIERQLFKIVNLPVVRAIRHLQNPLAAAVYANIEHVVQDDGSKDGTQDVIATHAVPAPRDL